MKISISRFLRFQKKLSKLYEEHFAAAAAKCGLSKPEADVLIFLANNPEYHTARDVAIYRELSKAYVSRAVDQLQRRGFLQVETQSEDRRFQNLLLTDAAAKSVQDLQSAQEEFFTGLTQGISAESAQIALDVLDRIMKSAGITR
ncbi:winged helix-turn-helix transcriptional regulator [Oscillibacter hominis]|uniref:Winged helix-turn-helix transcriptional regulator n=1 Tax=Oscillibacter hominis TaxID=2763056 RepID=A0A7G9B1K0_9FIRM|nr:MarR family transcriptional regulator [Oscillibacter hominis]QNL43431.1 winged helix-turn-helix transcriptional regulator [Oscillibacter hominis]